MSEIRFGSHPEDIKTFTTEQLRERFLIEKVFVPGQIAATYSMHDRMVVMGAVPTDKDLELEAYEHLTKATYFLERREMGIINIGGNGQVVADGTTYDLDAEDCLYLGKGVQSVTFKSADASSPARFYINSCPAHQSYPTVLAHKSDANEVNLGGSKNSNERTIFQYIHEDGIKSCQLVMGITKLHPGSIWNTFPPHTHFRRMEIYFYYGMEEGQMVMHFMGEPQQTRHLAMVNDQAVISPEWSIHSGAGTSNYSFIWSMAGENQAFTDMDGLKPIEVR